MNAARRFFRLFSDSPTYGRDKANIFSGFTIGTAALVLNAAVLLMVLPLMLNPDDSDFRVLTENLEFGQLLALILLGGATAFATFLIPLRMSTVFMGPRIGRYFDQVVLSGISPFRFLIGKATSQNLFIALAMFLLLPYLVLSVALGGMEVGTFFCGVVLVWLYSLMLALVTLWLSLYFNELFAAALVIAVAVFCCVTGWIPNEFQPMVMTPFPVLMQSLYASIPMGAWYVAPDFYVLFVSSLLTMLAISATASFAIYLGPLYGIITENSTFGEVVRSGDSKKKRWFRLRPHIQRSSEISFFYENRDDAFRRSEGLLRWGGGLLFLLLLSAIANGVTYVVVAAYVTSTQPYRWFAMEFHTVFLTIHGAGLLLAVLLFSHSKNNLLVRIALFGKRSCLVTQLDTVCFTLFLVWSAGVMWVLPQVFEQTVAAPSDTTVFRVDRSDIDLVRLSTEGNLVLVICAITLFAIQKLISHFTWLKSLGLFVTAGCYLLFVCLVPFISAMLYFEFTELRTSPLFVLSLPVGAMVSPFVVFGAIADELGRDFPVPLSTLPFYVGHGLLFVSLVVAVRMKSRKLRQQYLSSKENS